MNTAGPCISKLKGIVENLSYQAKTTQTFKILNSVLFLHTMPLWLLYLELDLPTHYQHPTQVNTLSNRDHHE